MDLIVLVMNSRDNSNMGYGQTQVIFFHLLVLGVKTIVKTRY